MAGRCSRKIWAQAGDYHATHGDGDDSANSASLDCLQNKRTNPTGTRELKTTQWHGDVILSRNCPSSNGHASPRID